MYRHGGNPYDVYRRLGIEPRSFVDFSVNINPLGPPRFVKDRWSDLYGDIMEYPSVGGEGIRTYYAGKYNLDPATVFPGNGASDVLYSLFQALSPKCTAIIVPSYHDYTRAAELCGSEIRPIPLLPEQDFVCPSEAVLSEYLKGSNVFVMGNPNNPTGTFLRRESILSLAETYTDIWFIVDESFSGFLPSPQDVSLLYLDRIPENIILIQSLTKLYALPGLRLGAAVASPEIVERLEAQAVPWRVNKLADSIAYELSHCDDYERETSSLVAQERTRLYREFSSLPGVNPVMSSANFFLVNNTNAGQFDSFLRRMLASGIVLRDCRNFSGLFGAYWRCAIRGKQDNTLLTTTLNDVLEIYFRAV